MRSSPLLLALFVTHRSALVDYANGIVGNRSQAEDLVQEAWLRLDAAAERRFLDEPLAYLYRIVRNLALDGRRHMARERRVIASGQYEAATIRSSDSRPDPETTTLHKDELRHVMEALSELPERTRIAVEMHRFGGSTLKEIAAFLNISVALAHALVADGVEHCKSRFDRT